ncbi:chorismate mutase [Acholeplasma manati]|uniref:Chorismate mutase n=1 Tax=Paracholeplasma manati TaxID=591373 RepID=A0ABT2Y4Q3_9MOLU|nr:chorismate mutase [Paracholeplasma manati]MCV2231717.1 chorismate mutase [Paracholeplasma manati]
MNKLEQARIKIDDIDRQLAELFKLRMQAVQDVLSYKKDNHLPVLDTIRESSMIERNVSRFDSKALELYYVQFLNSILEISRKFQEDHYE